MSSQNWLLGIRKWLNTPIILKKPDQQLLRLAVGRLAKFLMLAMIFAIMAVVIMAVLSIARTPHG